MNKQTSAKSVLYEGIQKKFWIALLLFVVVFANVVTTAPPKTEAATSSTINFQARLLQANGALVPDGYYNAQFKLYTVSTGGTAAWTETYYDSNGGTAGNDNRVRVANGYLTVNLGSQTAFPGTINWDQELWLTMNIGGTVQTATPTWDGEMNPRLKFTASPYAFAAGKLQSTTGANSSTLGFASQTASRSLLLPDESGTLCVQSSSTCGFAAASGSSNYIQNGTSQQVANFNISGNGTIGGILNIGTDTNLYRSAANTLKTDDTFIAAGNISSTGGYLTTSNMPANNAALRTQATGDTAYAYEIDNRGRMVWGTGAAVSDTNLYRSAASTLKTDGAFHTGGNVLSGGNIIAQSGNAADIRIGGYGPSSESGIRFGSAGDTNLYRSAADTLRTDDNFSVGGNLAVTGTIASSSTSNSYIMGALGLGTALPLAGSAMTIANSSWITAVDAAGTGYVNMFQVNANNEIQVGAALNIDGGIIMPTNGGQLTLVDMPLDSSAAVGSAHGYTMRVGTTNALTVYGQSDGAGGAQNVRVAIGSSITPAYPLDVVGDINSSTGLRVGGNLVCTSTGCTASAGSGSYIQNGTSVQAGANFNIGGNGVIGGTLNVTGVVTGNGSGLTALNGSNISSGTVADARLSSNVALLDNTQTFTGAKTFSNVLTINNNANFVQTGTGTLSTGTGAVSLNGATTVNSTLTVTGNTSLTTVNATKGVNAHGYKTANTQGVDNNKYTKLASTTITSQYQDSRTTFTVAGISDGGSGHRAIIDFYVKQQAAMGSAPIIRVDITNTKGITNGDIVAVTTVNTAGSTVVELYGRITPTFMQWAMSPQITTGGVPPVFHEAQPFLTALPAGVQTVSSYADVVAGTITGNGSGLTALNGSSISTGTVADARLSSNVALLNGAQTFTDTNTFRNTTNSTAAFLIQNAASQSLFVADTTNQRIAIGPAAAPANGVLTVGTNTTVASGGLYFGTDTNLYRNGANSLATDGSLSVGGTITGNGSGLTALNGSSISTGTVADARLSSNVALLDNAQTFTGVKTFRNAADSAAAFQIQNASGANVISVGTTSTVNLLANPGFEVNTTGWNARTGTTLTRTTVAAEHYEGLGAASLANTATANAGVNYPYALTSATSYTLSFYARLTTGSMTTLQAGRADNGSTDSTCTLSSATLSASGWNRYSCSFTTGTTSGSPYIFIRQSDATARTLFIDNVQLQTGATVMPYNAASITLNGVITDPLTVQNTSNSTSALQVVTVAGTVTLGVDTLNNRVGIGRAPTSGYTLEVGGTSYLNGNSLVRASAANQTGLFQVQNNNSWQLFNVDSTYSGLISNPGFEANTTGWTNRTGGTLTRITSPTSALYYGVASGQVVTTATANAGASFAYTMAANTQYTMSFYARASGSNMSTLSFGRQHVSGTDVDCATGQTVLTTGFTRYSCTFTSGPTITSSNIYVKQSDATARTLYIDAFRLEAGATATPYTLGSIALRGTINSPVNFQSTSDSRTAFQIQNAAGTSNLLVADTVNTRLAVGKAVADYTLDVAGDINSSTALRIGGVTVCTSAGCTPVGGSNYIANGTVQQTGNFYIQSANASSIGGIIKGAVGQSANIFEIRDSNDDSLAIFGSTGTFGLYNPGGALNILLTSGHSTFNNTSTGFGISSTTGKVHVKSSADAQASLIVQGNSPTQSANLFEIKNSAGTNLTTVDNAGALTNNGNATIRATTNSANTFAVQDSSGGNVMNVVTNNAFGYAELSLGGSTKTAGSLLRLTEAGNSRYQIGTDDVDLGGADGFFIYNDTTASTNFAITNTGATILRGNAGNNAFEVRDATNNTLVNVDTSGDQAFMVLNTNGTALFNADRTNGYVFNNGITEAGNLIDNPGFEAGAEMNYRNGWSGACTIDTNSTDARSGNKYARYTANGGFGGCGSKVYSVTPGDTIYAEAWVASTGNGQGGMYLEFLDKDKASSSFANSVWTNPGATWTRRAVNATVPAGVQYMTLNLTVRNDATTGEYRFDDVYLRKSSETAPMLYKNAVNSTSALQVQNAAGTSVFNVDTTNGRIGVGTATPSTKLHVAETGNVSNTVTISNTNTGVGANAQVSLAASNRTYNIGVGGAGNFFDNQFYIYDTAAGVSRLTINPSGNVGIGTNDIDVAARLDVQANSSGSATALRVSNNTSTGSIVQFQDGTTDVFTIDNNGIATFRNNVNTTSGFAVQRAGGENILTADTTNARLLIGAATGATLSTAEMSVSVAEIQTTLRVGDATNGVSFNDAATGEAGKLRLYGTARNTKKITLTPEFAGAVLDGAGSGTMTAGYDSTARKNFYKWTTTQTSLQTYDVVVTMAIPSDWSAWSSSNPVAADAWSSNPTDTGLTASAIGTNGTADAGLTNVSINPGSASVWTTASGATFSGTYVADGVMVMKFSMTARNNANIQLGNITLSYLSKF